VEHLAQGVVVRQSHVGESLIEAGDRAPIHLVVLPVPAVHPEDGRFRRPSRGDARRQPNGAGRRFHPPRRRQLAFIAMMPSVARPAISGRLFRQSAPDTDQENH
jgi:hypothetical protein